jgi:hypothetical protein
MSNLIFQQQGSSPTQAGAGYSQLYAKTDGIVYQQVGTNTEVPIMSGTEVGLSMSEITSDSSLSGSKVCAKSWCKFNGSGTPAVDKAFNVSSIADTAVGKFGISFVIDMVDVNYCVVGQNGDDTAGVNRNFHTSIHNQAAGSFEIDCFDGSSVDPDNVYYVVFDS